MGFLSWLYRKGLAGAIASDLVQKYLRIKSQHPHEDDEQILERVWNFWLTLNADKIQAEDDEDKVVRLNIKKEQNEKKTVIDKFISLKSLFSLYMDILYIEAGIEISDGKLWDNLMKVFIRESKKYGLDFREEYESFRRIRHSAKNVLRS
jgi:hypothetical protein